MRASGDQPGAGFVAGLIVGALLVPVLTALSRTVVWAATTDVIARAHAWWTTPMQVAPSDVVAALIPLVLVAMLVYLAVRITQLMGPGRWRA